VADIRKESAVVSVEEQEQYIAIWAKAVDTQMHFNEMSVKSRQLGLTFVAAALGVAIVLLSRGEDFFYPIDWSCLSFRIHVSVLIVLGALIAVHAVKGLDLGVYHKMLRGAVTFGEDFEENYMKKIFDLDKGMTQAISHFSRHADASVTKGPDGRYSYVGASKVTAEDKIRQFYKGITVFLWVGAVILFLLSNAPLWFHKPALSTTKQSSPAAAAAETSGVTGK
jgi:hypothetical protein